MTLTADYLAKAEQDARRFQGCWDQGTSGTLAAHTMRLLKEVRRMEGNGTIPEDWILRGERELKGEREATPTIRLRGDSLIEAQDDPPAVRLLLDAAEAVRQRRQTYGPPGEHFAITVALVNAAFGTNFKPEDWATIMQLDKIARSRGPGKNHPDNDIDVAGYAACRFETLHP